VSTPKKRFVYLGPAATFTEQALRSLKASQDAELAACPTVTVALDEVRSGNAFGAVVPIESSVEGSVPVTLDELAKGSPLMITREITVPVAFSLLARRGVALEDLRVLATHPHAAAQTRKWVAANLPGVEVIHTASTAAAAAGLTNADCAWDAAICAPLAAEPYDLDELAADIGDNQEAITRFVLVTRPGQPTPRTGVDKTSLVAFMHDDHPGALRGILEQFTIRGVNLTRIESRPTGAALGHYCFSIDCEGHVDDARVGEALMGLHRVCVDVRFLGSYERHDGKTPTLRPGTSDAEFTGAKDWLNAIRRGA